MVGTPPTLVIRVKPAGKINYIGKMEKETQGQAALSLGTFVTFEYLTSTTDFQYIRDYKSGLGFEFAVQLAITQMK